MLKDANHKGFTIIEVVITIAIGAAVMALVLNAVQGARRSQRNTNRAADVSAIAGAINQYNSARNALPTSWNDMSSYIAENDLAHYKASDISPFATTTGLTAKIKTAVGSTSTTNGEFILTGTIPAAATTLVATDEDETRDLIYIIRRAECTADSVSMTAGNLNGTGGLIDTGSSRQVIVLFSREGDPNIFCEEV